MAPRNFIPTGTGSRLGEGVDHALHSRKGKQLTEAAAKDLAGAKHIIPSVASGAVGAAVIGAGALSVGATVGALSKPDAPAKFSDGPLSPDEIAASHAMKPGMLGTVEKVAAAPSNMAVFIGGAAAGWLGERMAASGVKSNKTWLKKTGDVLAWPKYAYTNFSFGDISAKLGMKGAFAKATQPLFNSAGYVAEKIGGATGFNEWRANAHFGKASIAHQKAFDIANGMKIEHAPAELHSHLSDMRSAVMDAPHPSKIDMEKFGAAKTALEKTLKDSKSTLSKEASALVKSAEKLGGSVEKSMYHSGQSAGWSNVRETIKGAPGKISRANAGSGLMHASFVAMSALSMAHDTKSFAHNLASLHQMYKDMTGQDVSNMRLLLGTVPAPVAAMRKTLVANFGVKQLLDAANIGLNLKMNRMGMVSSMVAFMGVGMLSSGADSLMDVSMLPLYRGMSDAYNQRKDISVEAYTEFLVLAHKDLNNRGKDDPAVAALAAKYKAENLSPAEMLKRASGTQLMADLHAILQANEAKAPKPEISQVAKLTGAPQAAPEVIGAHTAKIAQAQAAPEQGRVV